MGLLILILLVVFFLGGAGQWGPYTGPGHFYGTGHWGGGGLGIVLIVIIVLLLAGRL
jgi:hypothetical protein